MGKGLSGEIIARNTDGTQEGRFHSVSVDFLLLHDPTCALLLGDLKDLEATVWDRDKILVTVDHFAPPSTVERANIVQDVLSFVEHEEIVNCKTYEGICHQLLVEGPWVWPGMVVLGADSHTTTNRPPAAMATRTPVCSPSEWVFTRTTRT